MTLLDIFNQNINSTGSRTSTRSKPSGSMYSAFQSNVQSYRPPKKTQPVQQIQISKPKSKISEGVGNFFTKAKNRVASDIIKTAQNIIAPGKAKKAKERVTKDVQETKKAVAQNIDTVKNLDTKRIGESFKGGTKTLPGTIKEGAGVIIDNWAVLSRKNMEVAEKILSIGQTKKYKEQRKKVVDKYGKPQIEFLSKKGEELRESGYQSKKKALGEFEKTYTPPEGKTQGLLEAVAFNLPQVLASTGLAVATSIVTKNPALGYSIGVSTSYGLGASEVYSEARDFGLSDRKATNLATIGGIAIGAFDFAPIARLVNKTGGEKVIQKSLVKNLSALIVSTGTQSGVEGVTEGIQEIIGGAIAQTYNENRDLLAGVTEAFFVGAILGGAGDFMTTGITGIMNRATGEMSKALSTPPEKRSEEQKEIVDTILNRELTPDEALSMVLENKMANTPVGKKIVKAVVQARQSGQNVMLSPSEDEKSLMIGLVEPGKGEIAKKEEPKSREVIKLEKEKYEGLESGMAVIRPDGTASVDVRFTKKAQGKGQGTQAVKDLEARLSEKKVKKVEIQSFKDAVGFWEKQGYKATGEGDGNLVPMQKTLTTPPPSPTKKVSPTQAQKSEKSAEQSLYDMPKELKIKRVDIGQESVHGSYTGDIQVQKGVEKIPHVRSELYNYAGTTEKDIITHEAGHAIESSLPDEIIAKFNDIKGKEIHKAGYNVQGKQGGLAWPEDFAESFSKWVNQPDIFKREFPLRAKYFEELGIRPEFGKDTIKLIQQAKNVAQGGLGDIKIIEQTTDSYAGQTNNVLKAFQKDKVIGNLQYSETPNKILIDMVEVDPSQRGKGYAKQLVEKLYRENTNKQIEWGMQTDSGAGLKKWAEQQPWFKNTPQGGLSVPPTQASKGVNVSGAEKTEKAFKESTKQKAVGQFELGTFGENAIERKKGKPDRVPKTEIPKTIENIVSVYKAGAKTNKFRSGNLVWVSKMPDGELRAIVTRKNKSKKEEIINFFKLGKDPEKFINNLKSFGVPSETRTRNLSVRTGLLYPLGYRDIVNIPSEKGKVKQPLVKDKTTLIEEYVDSKGIKFRTSGAEEGIILDAKREVSSKFFEHSDIVGKEFTSYSFLTNLAKSPSFPLKQAERDIIQETLDKYYKDEKRIPMAQFKRDVTGNMLPLDPIVTDTYADYGTSNLGLYDLRTATYIMNSPFEHGKTGHFTQDFARSVPREELEIREIPKQLQVERGVPNPRDQFAVVRKGVELTEENVEMNVFTMAETKEQAQEWIDSHTISVAEESFGEKTKAVKLVKQGLFGHFRTADEIRADEKIAHIVEVQSDVFQAGRTEELGGRKQTLEKEIEGIKFDIEHYKNTLRINNKNIDAGVQSEEQSKSDLLENKNLESVIEDLKGKLKIKKEQLAELSDDNLKEKSLFLSYKNIWHERIIREAINIKAREGANTIRFPMPRTVAIVEGFVAGSDSENIMPYDIINGDENRLERGDTIDYGGEEMTVVSADSYNITVARSDKVEVIDTEAWRDDDIQGRWDDTLYNFKDVEKYYGEVNTAGKAQKVLDDTSVLDDYAKFLYKKEDIEREKESFEVNTERKDLGRDIVRYKEDIKNNQEFLDLLKAGVMEKENITRENIEDLSFKDRLKEKYGLGHGFWNYILNAYEEQHFSNQEDRYVRKNTTIAEAKEATNSYLTQRNREIENILVDFETQLEDIKESHKAAIYDIKNRVSPKASALKKVPKSLLEAIKTNRYAYSLDSGVNEILNKMADADPDETYSVDDFEQEWKDNEYENYELDLEGIYGNDNVFYDVRSNNAYVVEEGSYTEQMQQPDEYEQAPSADDFDINSFEGNQRTVLDFYEKQLLPYVRKFRRDNLEKVTDDSGNEWLETKVTPDDLKPPTAYRIKDNLAKVGIKISNAQEQEIIKLNREIFGDTNVKVISQILAKKKALGAYSERMIKILDRQADPKETFYHEAVHKYLDVFTDRTEYIEILKEAQKKYNLDDISAVEEKLAEDFIQYAKSREGAIGKIKVYFDRIIKRLTAYFKGQSKIDALYQDIISGKAKKKKTVTKTVPRSQIPVGTGEEKVSTLEARIKGVLDSLSPEIIDQLGLTTYKQMSKEENIKAAINYVRGNQKEALQVLSGEVEAPRGILRNSIYVALENVAKRNMDLALKLASISSTRMGQEISILSEVDPDSPVRAIRDIIKVREKTFQKRFGKKPVSKVKEAIVGDIKKKVKVPDKYDWNAFLDSIEC